MYANMRVDDSAELLETGLHSMASTAKMSPVASSDFKKSSAQGYTAENHRWPAGPGYDSWPDLNALLDYNAAARRGCPTSKALLAAQACSSKTSQDWKVHKLPRHRLTSRAVSARWRRLNFPKEYPQLMSSKKLKSSANLKDPSGSTYTPANPYKSAHLSEAQGVSVVTENSVEPALSDPESELVPVVSDQIAYDIDTSVDAAPKAELPKLVCTPSRKSECLAEPVEPAEPVYMVFSVEAIVSPSFPMVDVESVPISSASEFEFLPTPEMNFQLPPTSRPAPATDLEGMRLNKARQVPRHLWTPTKSSFLFGEWKRHRNTSRCDDYIVR
ncbi:hypothetical protein V1512DRAFT_61155 [Lipomyces arxii]|uniref:uncharacterized protein n=1 Tax=Lipomyces arxii TaxID=56418 RepID=UPI0034CE5D50